MQSAIKESGSGERDEREDEGGNLPRKGPHLQPELDYGNFEYRRDRISQEEFCSSERRIG